MTIFEQAAANWPEDEAGLIAEYWNDPTIKEDYTAEEWRKGLKADCDRMIERVFESPSDKRRFMAAIKKYTEPEAPRPPEPTKQTELLFLMA